MLLLDSGYVEIVEDFLIDDIDSIYSGCQESDSVVETQECLDASQFPNQVWFTIRTFKTFCRNPDDTSFFLTPLESIRDLPGPRFQRAIKTSIPTTLRTHNSKRNHVYISDKSLFIQLLDYNLS